MSSSGCSGDDAHGVFAASTNLVSSENRRVGGNDPGVKPPAIQGTLPKQIQKPLIVVDGTLLFVAVGTKIRYGNC